MLDEAGFDYDTVFKRMDSNEIMAANIALDIRDKAIRAKMKHKK